MHKKDGDTIDVSINGQKQTVRLLLLDTPGSAFPKIPSQKMGKEASSFLKKQLKGKSVTSVYDRGQKRTSMAGNWHMYFVKGCISTN